MIAPGDGGNWIDPPLTAYFHAPARIADRSHAGEHPWDCAGAVHGAGTARAASGPAPGALLWGGKVKRVIEGLSGLPAAAPELGPATEPDAAGPCRVPADNVAHLTTHGGRMNYPAYRRRGRPTGSGETEAAAKQFDKRIKGTEQFWPADGVGRSRACQRLGRVRTTAGQATGKTARLMSTERRAAVAHPW